eukprot:contig_9924_g2372
MLTIAATNNDYSIALCATNLLREQRRRERDDGSSGDRVDDLHAALMAMAVMYCHDNPTAAALALLALQQDEERADDAEDVRRAEAVAQRRRRRRRLRDA